MAHFEIVRVLLIASAAIALLGAGGAAAAPAAQAEQLAPDIAAKLPMQETVYCAVDDADWQAALARYRLPATTRGFTDRATAAINLPPRTCAELRAPFAVSSALAYRALYHEFIHAALHTSVESQAECWSLFMFRYWTRRFFGASAADAQAAYEIGWADHATLAPEYRGGCVFEKRDTVSPLNGF